MPLKNGKNQQLMTTMNSINQRYPKSVTFSASGINHRWKSPVKYLSQRYTICWKEIAVVK
jgi:hypothetical protein